MDGNNIEQYHYIAVSPSGGEIATLDRNAHKLVIWHVTEGNAIEHRSTYPLRHNITENSINWSLAISDEDSDGNTLIALSCFNFNNLEDDENENSSPLTPLTEVIAASENDISQVNPFSSSSTERLVNNEASTSDNANYEGIINYLSSIELRTTRIVSISSGLKKWPEIEGFYGFLQFFKGSTLLTISNNFGIIRICKDDSKDLSSGSKYIHNLLTRQTRSRTIDYHNRSDDYEKKSYEIIGYPNNFVENLEIMYEEEQINFIKNSIMCGKLIIQNEENNLEMYNLLSKNMEMLYYHSKFQTELTNNILAISKNAKLLAVTINKNSVALYLNENSLNIACKEFSMIDGKIIYMTFFNDDEKLLLLEKDETKNNLIIWNIFEDTEKIYSFDNQRFQILDLFGTIAYIDNSRDINDNQFIKLFDEENPNEFEIRNNDEILMINLFEVLESLELSEIYNTRGYDQHERRKKDTEPWLDSDHYQTFRWLDNNETTRISYGFYTIQIWKNNELIYIYSANYNNVQESSEPLNDNNVNEFVNGCFTTEHVNDAYNSLIFFCNLKLSTIKIKKLKVDEFIEKTKRIIHNVINNNPSLWRLLDVKYNLTENLIRSQSNDIIELILNSTEENTKLHIPQLYDWNGRKKTRHELLIALENNNIRIIQRLLDYYSNNAMDNAGWMITLTQALPKISEKFPELIKELFNNPVFYEKKMHLAKSRIKTILSSNPYSTFIVDTRLPTKYKLRDKIPRDLNDNPIEIEIYMIPLPDFNEFLEGRKQTINCPFFKLVAQKNLDLFYKKNSTLEATVSAKELGIGPEGEKFIFVETGSGTRNYSYAYIEKETNTPNFLETLEMVYLWLFGSWANVQDWNYISVKILAIVASFFLILIMTNIFVALMTDDINRAIKYSEITSFKYKADFILESYLYPLFVIIEKFYSKRKKEFTFEHTFYYQPTFHLLLDRYIFYIRTDRKSWKTEISKGTDELIENINEKVRKLDEKLDRYICNS
uniref:Ion transport domain-containing protein n=1 Tax=Rhizophagus irregularis (strain DAOM 181602 / DAOM 197198 / MUCL 43194) TaxID=747089 RepID=U9UHB3_RHIID